MQRPQGISAHADDAPDDGDAGVRLSAALNRLATLRATIHVDWSDGPASLLTYATTDGDDGDGIGWALTTPATPFAPPSIDTAPAVIADAPVALRGRFENPEDSAPVSVDRSWLDLVSEVAVIDAPSADAAPTPVWTSPGTDAATLLEAVAVVTQDEAAVALAFAEDCAALALQTRVVEIDDVEPAFAIGAAPNLFQHLAPPEMPVIVPASAPVAYFSDDVETVAYGAVANIATLFTAAAAAIEPDAPASPPSALPVDNDDAPVLGAGAFAITFAPIVDVASPAARAETGAPAESVEDDGGLHFGAAPALAALLDAVPILEPTVIATRPFDPMSLIDDALADAFDALVCVPDPVDPLEAAWAPDTFADTGHAAQLAACETALWALPRHVPCIETFLLTPNHETAVRLTRALRVRADALQARAFAESAGFGFLRSEDDVTALWFLADALADAPACATGDDSTSFADWQISTDGLIVVTAPDIAPPRRPPPLISEEELDALFAHVDDAQSHVLLDDRGDDPVWNETFWHDVDAYLEHVSEVMDPAIIEDPPLHDSDFDIHDLEVRAVAPGHEPSPVATYFWMPGDADDLAVTGDGADLFIVGADDTAAVVLVEDGATYAMRTGKDARMDEVVVSLSADPWRHIDGMDWRRIAVLSGVAQIRVTQNEALTRRAVIAGAFFATTLEEDGVRLVLSEGDVEYPVIRVGGLPPVGWATLDERAA